MSTMSRIAKIIEKRESSMLKLEGKLLREMYLIIISVHIRANRQKYESDQTSRPSLT